jgi:predicted phosphoribosyltransferase
MQTGESTGVVAHERNRFDAVFRDRKDAGRRLGDALLSFQQENPLVLAIPRGGVEVGFQVALRLEAPLAILVARKLPLPGNPEAGFGAIAEDGSTFLVEDMAGIIGPRVVEETICRQKQEIQRRIQILRKGEPLPPLEGRTVIVLDDGIAMGSTIRAAIAMCRNQKVKRIVAAAPVASPSTAEDLKKIADEVVILEKPPHFRAVAQVYEDWYDVTDEEVLRIMAEYRRLKTPTERS